MNDILFTSNFNMAVFSIRRTDIRTEIFSWFYKVIHANYGLVHVIASLHILPGIFFSYGARSPIAGYGLLILEVFRDHTQRRTTVGRTPLDEWSVLRRDLYLTTCNTHNRQTSMHPAGFEITISAGKRPQTYVLDRAATGTCILSGILLNNYTKEQI